MDAAVDRGHAAAVFAVAEMDAAIDADVATVKKYERKHQQK